MQKLLICVDPGKNNYAISVLTKKAVVVEYMLLDTLNDIKNPDNFVNDVNIFSNRMYDLFKRYNKDRYILVFERMIPRTFNMRGNTAEIVNTCIGIMLAYSKARNTIPLTAATWKNHRTKNNLEIKNKQVPVHVTDSVSMGIYYLLQREILTLKQAQKLVKRYNNRM